MTERLTHIEELELVKDYQLTGNKDSLNKLIEGNEGLVHKLVSKFPMRSSTCSYHDLYQEGMLGFIHAVEKFQPERGCRLSTYSYNWINAYVRRYYQNHSRNIRIPVHMSDKQFQLNRQVEALTNELGRTPTRDEVREVNEKVDTIMTSMVNCVSLNAVVGDSSELEELVGGVDNTEEFESTVDCEILLQKLRDEVSARDYNILIKRFGLDGSGERTLSELAEEFDITRSRCHQIEGHLLQPVSYTHLTLPTILLV